MTSRDGQDLLVGVAVGDVTPPVGIDVSGFCLRLTTRAVHRSLRASVVVFSDGEHACCIVAADLLGFTVPYARALREAIAARLDIPAAAVLVAASHTHNAPALSLELKVGGEQDAWTDLNDVYERFWRAKVLGLCEEARRALQPARIAASREGRAAIGVNRRVKLPDGRMIIGRNPAGPVDHSVGVVRVDRMDGQPLVTLFNYACHPISLGPEAEIISPDYPGAAREIVEAITGAPAIFLQGAGADAAPIDGMGPDPAIADHLGRTLGIEVAKVWSAIDTRNIERREEIVQSYNAIASLVKIERPLPSAWVRAMADELALPLGDPPVGPEVDALLRRAREQSDALVRGGAPKGQKNIAGIELRWAEMLAAQRPTPPVTVKGVVQAIVVDGVVFAALPVEPFCGIGREILERLGPDRTIVCGYANGTVGYCPMPEDYPAGGYEVESAHRLYGQPAAFRPEVSGMLVDAVVRLAEAAARR
jgi:neutral ceramidase